MSTTAPTPVFAPEPPTQSVTRELSSWSADEPWQQMAAPMPFSPSESQPEMLQSEMTQMLPAPST